MNRLHQSAPISRKALAEMTGLNKSTVSSLVNELIDLGFIHETEVVVSGVGRPSVPLELAAQAGILISAEIGVGWLSSLCTDFLGDTLWSHREDFDVTLPSTVVLDRLIEILHLAITASQDQTERQRPLGITIALHGLVELDTGTLLFAPNLHWRQVPVRDYVQQNFPNVPVYVDNEAKLAALGEYVFGAAHDAHAVLYISAGDGVGGAFINVGQLLRGASGFAGEFGHMTVYPDGDLCACGNHGCWETRASATALFRHVVFAIRAGRDSLLRGREKRLTVQMVSEAARKEDAVALAAFQEIGRDLGLGLVSLVNAFNPDLIVLGGTLCPASDLLIPHIKAELSRRALHWDVQSTVLLPARHTTNASLMGGIAAIFDAIVADPTAVAVT
jgi:glucokinase-like ROK family protein